jgi:hypothetical protein
MQIPLIFVSERTCSTPERRHGLGRDLALPALRNLSDEDVLSTSNTVQYTSSWNSQKLAAEQLLPEQATQTAFKPSITVQITDFFPLTSSQARQDAGYGRHSSLRPQSAFPFRNEAAKSKDIQRRQFASLNAVETINRHKICEIFLSVIIAGAKLRNRFIKKPNRYRRLYPYRGLLQ